jgi:hypothetical protein
MRRLALALVLAAAPLSGCAELLDRVFSAAGDRAGQMVGDAIGNRVGTMIAGQTMLAMNQLTPELTQAYAMGVFAVVYYHGGFTWQGKGYQPGEFTQWEGQSMAQGDFFEKAFLRREADKSEWWRVKVQEKGNDGKPGEAVFEALFSAPAKDGSQAIKRMRAKLPGQTAGGEVPITAENRGSWVLRPTSRLTPESLKGATVGTEKVAVPAGSFTARHVRFAHGAGQAEWWLVDTVPGGVVKYGVRATDQGTTDEAWMRLRSHGKGAKPQLI